jgi:hypothetical protein
MSRMKKKYLIAGGIAVVLLIIIVFVIVFQQTSLTSQNPAVTSPANQMKTSVKNSRQVTLAPPSNTPQEAVKQFYNYYFSSPTNPLANGAFESNPYLAPDFKGLIKAYYNNGNVPVFCLQNKRANVSVGQEVPVNDANEILMEETISEASPGTKDLYTVIVQNVNDKWLIYDIHCL